jgi:hypothetical protein
MADGGAAPTALNALINDMLAHDAAARPSAEEVAERLEKAGFAAGPAPTRYLGGAPVIQSEVIESVESIQPVHREARSVAAPTAVQQVSSGVSPRILFGGLIAALAIFLAIIYLLPVIVRPGCGCRKRHGTDTALADRSRRRRYLV